jgi:hypothetical protein
MAECVGFAHFCCLMHVSRMIEIRRLMLSIVCTPQLLVIAILSFISLGRRYGAEFEGDDMGR